MRVVPRRARALGVPAADRAPGDRPRADGRVRAAGRPAAVRRLAPAVGVRQPRHPVRAAQGAPVRGGPVRRGAQTAAARPPAGDRGRHLADRRRLARRVQRAGAAMAVGPCAARRLPGAGRRRPGEHRRRAPPSRALGGGREARGTARRGAGGHDPRPGRGVAGGPVVVQRRAGRPGDRGAPGAARVRRRATRSTSRWPTSRPTSARRRRPRPPSWSCPIAPTRRRRSVPGGGASTPS